jgi:hypothetical protein
VKPRVNREPEASLTVQLEVEIEWLAGRLPGSFLRTPPELSLADREIVSRIENILRHPDLAPFLNMLERHNRNPKILPGRRLPRPGPHFLLGPHLFQVLMSVEARRALRAKLPTLDKPAAEVRAHLQMVSGRCIRLANLIRKGPQPHVALAGETGANEALKVFAPWTELFEASNGSDRQVCTFAELLDKATGWFDELAGHVPRAKENIHTGNGALRVRAAEFLPYVFRKRLDHPYHAHVATIATIVSGIETDADFVKKVEARQSGPNKSGQK